MVNEQHGQCFKGKVQGVVIGENNTVTMVYENGKQCEIPFSAPSRPQHKIIGRTEVLQNLKSLLFEERVISLKGLPGVGKTIVATELAHDQDVLSIFNDGVLWEGLGRKADVLSVLGSMAIKLGIPSERVAKLTNVEDRATVINSTIGTHRMLIVADDVWSVEAALAMKVGGPNCGYIITTRMPQIALSVAGPCALTVGELNTEDGLALISQFVPELVRERPAKLKQLVEAVGGLPLAIVITGKHLQSVSYQRRSQCLDEAINRIQKAEERMHLTQPQAPLDHHPSLSYDTPISLFTVIGISYEALDEASRRTLQALTVFPPKPNSLSNDAAVAVSGESEQTLSNLLEHGLLESKSTDRFTLHQTVWDFARGEVREEIFSRRLVKFFVDYVGEHKKDYDCLDIEADNILAALQEAFKLKMLDSLVEGTNALYQYLETRGKYAVADTCLETARQVAVSINDTAGLTTVLMNLGRVAERRGNFASAEVLWTEAMQIARGTGNSERLSIVLMNLGGLQCRLSKLEKAEEYLLEGLRLAREIGHCERVSTILNNLANVPYGHGDIAGAEKCWLEALDIARKLNDPMVISHPLTNLGMLEYMRGNIGKAEMYLLESLDLARKINHYERISDLLVNLGVMEYMRERYSSAEIYWMEALQTAKQIGVPNTVSNVLGDLALIEYDRGNLAKAEIYWSDALGIARALGQPNLVGCLLGNLGAMAIKRGNLKRAEQYLTEGLILTRKGGEPYGVGSLLQIYGELQYKLGDFGKSEESLLEALTLGRRINQPQLTIEALGSLGEMECLRGDHKKSEDYFVEALNMARKTKNCQLTSSTLIKSGENHLRQHKLGVAYLEFREAHELARSRKELVGHALFGLARVASEQNELTEARRKGQNSLAVLRAMGHCLASDVADWLAHLPKN